MSYFSFDTKTKSKKCAVIGCSGMGGAIANALLQSGLTDRLVLLDPHQRLADGLAADLCGALPLHADADVWAGDSADLCDCALIVLALGSSPLHECAHADLAALNAPQIHRAVSDIAAYNKDTVLLVVSQPCELMTYTALRYAGLPPERVIGIGTLPLSLRLRRMIGKYLGVDARYVDCAVLGQADATATVCQSLAHICAMPLSNYLHATGRSSDPYLLHTLFSDAIHAEERAEDAKGCAEYALANACVQVADAILNDRSTPLSLCVSTQCFPELSHVCLSLPCLLGRHGARPIPELAIAPAEMEQLQRSAARLRARMLECEQLFVQK